MSLRPSFFWPTLYSHCLLLTLLLVRLLLLCNEYSILARFYMELGIDGDIFWMTLAGQRRRQYCFCAHTHTHTHPFNGPLSGTTRVSRYQKGKTSLDFTEARDSE